MYNLKFTKIKDSVFLYPLFSFSKKYPVPTKIIYVWSNDKSLYKLHIQCDLGICLSFDQDVYNALSFTYKEKSGICYRDIARFLKICPRSWGTKIKNSIDRLNNCNYCLYTYDGNDQQTREFRLLEKDHREMRLFCRSSVDDFYVNLKTGMTRRLYQILEIQRDIGKPRLRISEKLLCSIFPMQDRHATKRRGRIENISANLIEAGYLRDYFFSQKEKVCVFEFPGVF